MKAETVWIILDRRGNFLSGHASRARKWAIQGAEKAYMKPWDKLKSEWGLRVIKAMLTPVKSKRGGHKGVTP